ncbi:MAG: DMT family transporter [Hyphomicrobiaceae bacterium]
MQNNLLGIVATLGAGAAMIASDSFARAATHDVPLGAAIAGRGIVAFLILAAAAKASGQLQWHPRMRSLPVLTRIMAEVGAGMFFIGSLQHIPIANAASVLQFIPLVTMLVASVLFAEAVGWRRWLAGFAGLLGVLLILKPGTSGFTAWSLLAVGAMLCMATRDLATSRIERGVPTLLIGTVTAVATTTSGLVLLGLTDRPLLPTAASAGFVLGAGIALSIGFFCLVVAARSAEMSAIAPFRYFTLLWAILIGYFAWGEVPDDIAFVGIAIVVGSGLYAFARERKLTRARRAAEPAIVVR